jgi:hypothetical protein
MALGKKTGGRTAGTPNKNGAAVREFAGQFTEQAVKGLVSIARAKNSPPAARVAAWKEILDRAVGKAPNSVGFEGDSGERLGMRRVVIELSDGD